MVAIYYLCEDVKTIDFQTGEAELIKNINKNLIFLQ